MRTRVKICGITREQDAAAAIKAGADALGFVFYARSPRAVSVERATEICAALPPFVTRVGLFVNAGRDEIARTVELTGIDLLQFHGDETSEDCLGHDRPHIRAIRMREGIDLHALRVEYPAASALLLDAYRPGVPGGTGSCFDWSRIPPDLAPQIILAGGLDAGNIAEAIRAVGPFAVDVSGGVEAAKGIKDPEKIFAFMRGVESVRKD